MNTSGQDYIKLTGIDASSSADDDQAFSSIILGGADAFIRAGQLKFDAATHILFGNTDSDAEAEFSIQLVGVSSISASDIIL
ncbi:MAG: hypothetical protein HGB23_10160 [Chlorobiaceae bacterium]|nr:hypothetical protein [Chlorobiaceae bacterium]